MARTKKRTRAGSVLSGMTARPTGTPPVGPARRKAAATRGAGRLGSALRSADAKTRAEPGTKRGSPKAKPASKAKTKTNAKPASRAKKAQTSTNGRVATGRAPARPFPKAKQAAGAPRSLTARHADSPPAVNPTIGASRLGGRRALKAEARGKAARLEQSGLQSRVRGHVSARGRRMQSRRDSKN